MSQKDLCDCHTDENSPDHNSDQIEPPPTGNSGRFRMKLRNLRAHLILSQPLFRSAHLAPFSPIILAAVSNQVNGELPPNRPTCISGRTLNIHDCFSILAIVGEQLVARYRAGRQPGGMPATAPPFHTRQPHKTQSNRERPANPPPRGRGTRYIQTSWSVSVFSVKL